jgi:hypothetical protein
MTQPGAIYYLLLYIIIIVLQFWKTYPLVKEEPIKYNWRNYFYVSLQVLYTSAGVAILLLAQLKDWMGVIMMAYVFLLLFSSFLDTVGAKFQQNIRLVLHITIIALVLLTTVISYEKVLPKSVPGEDQKKATVAIVHHYKIALPYLDRTLAKHVGEGRMRDTLLYFSTSIDGASRGDAVLKAMELALNNQHGSIKPFMPSPKGIRDDIHVLSEQAIVEEVFAVVPQLAANPI